MSRTLEIIGISPYAYEKIMGWIEPWMHSSAKKASALRSIFELYTTDKNSIDAFLRFTLFLNSEKLEPQIRTVIYFAGEGLGKTTFANVLSRCFPEISHHEMILNVRRMTQVNIVVIPGPVPQNIECLIFNKLTFTQEEDDD